MKKIFQLALLALCVAVNMSAVAAEGTTAGDGTQWTLAKLAAADMGIEQKGDTFTLSQTVTIAKGDHFSLTPGAVVKLAKGVSFQVEGTADFNMPADGRVLFTRSAEDVVPGVVYMMCDDAVVTVKNVDFEYAGLKNFSETGLIVDSCTFRYHAASSANGSSAISMGTSGAAFTITNCIFERNQRAAIGGAANYSNPLTVENCQFLYNGTSNQQYPQLNLTAASQVTIRQCVIIGDPSKTRVGGIVVADLLGLVPDANLLIEDCFVKDARFGIAVYSGQKAVVRNNILVNNNAETNPNNGGSGINIYDTTGQQNTTITGNFITGSLWGVTVVATKPGTVANLGRVDVDESADDYNIGQNVFFNNGNSGVVYDLYNNSANTVYAQNNFWLTAATFRPEGIDTCIFDKSDNAALGEVVYKAGGQPSSTNLPAMQQVMARGVQAIYTLGGVRTGEMSRGLNIVRKEDGTTLKVVR